MDAHIVIPITDATDWEDCDQEAHTFAERWALSDGFDILGPIERSRTPQHFVYGHGVEGSFDCLDYTIHTTRTAPYGGPALVLAPIN